MSTIQIRDVMIGQGRTKICVPIVGKTEAEILAEAEAFAQIPADFAEWRVDFFDGAEEWSQIEQVLIKLRKCLGNTPLLFTVRTSREGGQRTVCAAAYEALLKKVSAGGYTDALDVELFMGDELVKNIVSEAHLHGVKVIVSNHDFHKTPEQDEIMFRLVKMLRLGADIPKIAVMPQSKRDVLTLLLAAEEMQHAYPEHPFITISMGQDGMISRLCGEVFGSAVTFASSGKASAPGQVNVQKLDEILTLIHDMTRMASKMDK